MLEPTLKIIDWLSNWSVKDNKRGSEALGSVDLKQQKSRAIDRLNKRLVLHVIFQNTLPRAI